MFLLGGILEVSSAAESKLFTQLMSIKAQDADLSTVPPQAIDGLKKEFRDVSTGTVKGDDIRAKIYLLRFGDTGTIEEMTRVFEKYTNSDAWEEIPFYFERARQPLLIGQLAASLSASSEKNHSRSDGLEATVVPPRPTAAAILILKTISPSEEFSKELRDWAEAMLLRSYDQGFVKTMQSWWDANRDLYEKRQYDQLRPQAFLAGERK
jgi:hypothetical protein